VLQFSSPIPQGYRFRSKDGTYVRVQSEWRAFSNPWTRDVEYLVAKNCLLRSTGPPEQQLTPLVPANLDNFFCQSESPNFLGERDYFGNVAANGSPGGREITRLINSHVEASKIGRQIAEEALDTRRRGALASESPSVSNSPPSPELELGQGSLQVMVFFIVM
jgi:aryl hydrocarbon receptor nuclear translocator-like protein 1